MVFWAYAAGLLGSGIYLLLNYFWAVWAPGLWASLLLALILLSCTGVGRVLLRFLAIAGLSESEKTLIGCTLGLGLLTQAVFLLGIVGGLRLWAVTGLLGAAWVVGYAELRGAAASLEANRNLLRERGGWVLGVAGLLGLAYVAAWAPPHQYDALVYHLELAARYVRLGRIVPAQDILFSHFPQNGEMLFSVALLFQSRVLAQLFSWAASAMSVWWIFEMGKREMPLTAALGACALAAGHTAVMLLSSVAYVETLAMLWITASVLAFCRWLDVGAPGPEARGWLALSATLAGLGLGTKYYAGICGGVLALWLAARWVWLRIFGSENQSGLEEHRALFLFVSVFMLFSAPWLVKNCLMVGNPVFPFLYQYFPHRTVAWGVDDARRYFSFLTEYGHRPGRFWSDLLQFPASAASGSLRYGGGMDVLGDFGWAPLIVLLPAVVFAASKNKTLLRILAYGAVHVAIWFCTGVVLRFLTVLVPLWCLAAAAGLSKMWEAFGRWGRILVTMSLVLFGSVNVGVFFYVHSVFETWGVLFGTESREAYLSRRLDYYSCARYARENLGKNDRILIVGDQRGYYVEQDHVVTSPMESNAFVTWANEARDSEDLARRLAADGGFTHLLTVPREASASRLGGYGIFAFTELGHRNWLGLTPYLKNLYAPGPCALFQIDSGKAASSATSPARR